MSTSLFDSKLIFFTGKGGVGKSAVSLSFAHALASQGKKVLHISVSQQNFAGSVFGRKSKIGYEEVKLDERLYAMNLDPREALHEYAVRQIKFEMIYRYVFENKIIRYFLDATPGLDDLLSFGKIIDALDLLEKKKKSKHYDAVLVDMPATGHGMNMLRIPKMVITMIPAGPLHRHAQRMLEVMNDESLTSLCAVTLPEEMPVNETLEMTENYRRDLHMPLRALFVNGVYPKLFETAELQQIRASVPAPLQPAVQCALSQSKRRAMHEEQLKRLKAEPTIPAAIELPYLFVPQFDRSAIVALSTEMTRQMAGKG